MNHALSASPDFSGFRSASSSPQGMGPSSSSQERPSFTSYPYEELSQLFYEDYEPSEYASTSTSPWHHQGALSSESATRHHDLPLFLPPSCYAKYAGPTSAPCPPGSLPATTLTRMRRELPPATADPDDDYIHRDHDGDARHHFALSPLSPYQDHRLSLYPLPEEVYLSMELSDTEKCHYHQPGQRMDEGDVLQTETSILMFSDDDDPDTTTSPDQRSYSSFLDDLLLCRWSLSPESVDTDLDDESSVLSLSLSLSSSMSSSSLSPPFPDSSELRQVDEDDEDEDEDVLAISTLELSPSPLTATTITTTKEEQEQEQEQDREQEHENRYQHIDEYPLHLYNIIQPSPLPSPQPLPASDSPPPAQFGDPQGEELRPPSPLDSSPSHLPSLHSLPELELEVGRSPQPQHQYEDEDELHLQFSSLSPPLLPLSSPPQSPPLSPLSPPPPALSGLEVEPEYSSGSLGLGLGLRSPSLSPVALPSVPPASSPSFSSPPPPPLPTTQEPVFAKEPESGLDSLGLGLLSPSLSTVGLPPLFSSSSSFYDFGDGRAPESPSRRRSTDLPALLEDDGTDGGFSPFSSVFSSPASEYQYLDDQFGPPERRSHFLSLPGSDTDDDLIPSELASKNYVPDPTITVPSSSVYFSPSEKKSGRSLLMWDADGSIEYPAEGGFGFRGSNYHYPPPRSPSPDLLDLDPKKIEELGGGEEGRRVWEARQRAVREESLSDFSGSGYGYAERDGREKGRERRKELSALLRLKLGLIDGKDKGTEKQKQQKTSGQSESESAGNSESESTAAVSSDIATHPTPTNDTSTSTSTGSKTSASLPAPIPSPNPSHVVSPVTSSLSSSSSTRHSSSSSSTKPRITSMAQLVANMVFHRQQHPHSTSTGHVHEPSRPKRTTAAPTRSQTWTAGPVAGVGGDSSSSDFGVDAGLDNAGSVVSSPLAKSYTLSTSKTPRSPLRQVTLPEELMGSDEPDEEEDGERNGEAHTNKTPTSATLSPLFLCASPLSFSVAELGAS